MKLLLYSWNANNEQILSDNLIKMGFDVVWFQKECKYYTRDMELAMEMIPFIHAQEIEAVISFNYFPIISMICNTCQIPYYSWVYDCPHFTLYAKQIVLSCNHIGIFDQEMVRQLKDYGVNTVYYVPLASDTAYFNKMIIQASRQEVEKYQCDISFTGSLYTGEYNYYDVIFPAGQIKGEGNISRESLRTYAKIDEAINRQCFSYQKDYLKPAIMDGDIDFSTLQMQMEKTGLVLGEDYFVRAEDILLTAVLEKKVTVEERRILLTEIIKRFSDQRDDMGSANNQRITGDDTHDGIDKKYDFRLYTSSDTEKLPELAECNYGVVNYYTQMPLVFAGSKINLNISLRSIHSGIPLRVLDIMACGGFVLSNWQPEIEESFEEGIEIVTFKSLEECLDKTAYYLAHEDERKHIARNGQKKVQERFSYQIGLEKLLC